MDADIQLWMYWSEILSSDSLSGRVLDSKILNIDNLQFVSIRRGHRLRDSDFDLP